MTRIAVFCDGTWNSPDIKEPTSVHELSERLVNDFSKGQLVAYFPGIGTDERFDTKFQKFLHKYGGGAFGWGLDAKVKQAYQFICKVYQDGDEIYLFGFSRGAYTARSVAGMIRKCGLVTDTSPEGINAAFALYRKRGKRNHPDADHIWKERRRISPRFGTSDEDINRRDDGSKLVNLAYLGVWDTVGARGIPRAMLGPVAALWNSQYKFHDMQLSSLVKSARHAVAIDELRRLFKPALWTNLDKLNPGRDDPLRPYQQVWFAGNHGDVGGSGPIPQISYYPLDWIIQGAGRLTMKSTAALQGFPGDPKAGTIKRTNGLLSGWRDGPHHEWELHPSARERVMQKSDYRPSALHRLFPAS